MRFLTSSIRTKIIFPYILLTLLVGMVGTYIVTRLVFDSVEERLDNQLLVAARVGAETIVAQENDRLAVLRQISRTSGLPEALKQKNFEELESIILPIAANSPQVDSFIILDEQALEVFNVNRNLTGDKVLGNTALNSGADFSDWSVVEQILAEDFDQLGDKFAVLAQDADGRNTLLYTVGPIWLNDNLAGIVLTGSYLQHIVENIKQNVQTDVTIYDASGNVLYTTYHGPQAGIQDTLAINPEKYAQILEDPETVPKQQVKIVEQDHQLLFAPFKLRGEDIGVFSVGLPSDFVVQTSGTSRNIFSALVFLSIAILLGVGLVVTRQILKPIAKLVSATGAIAAGDLERRTGVASGDEIGRLATSFDQMTVELQQRTEDLEEETSKIRAILASIADGVLVQDKAGNIIEQNPAAQDILADFQNENNYAGPKTADNNTALEKGGDALNLLEQVSYEEPRRFTIGERSVSALAAPVITADEQELGSVFVLRDITLEVESEQLKNKFIESISHELLTPMVPIKGYMDLLLMVSAGKLDDRQKEFIAKISNNLDDLHNLISTLIDVTQIEAGGLGLDKEAFQFDEMVAEAVAYWKPIMVERQVTFKAHLHTANLSVFGDMQRLRRAIDALLDNASTYNHPGGAVDLYLKQEDNNIQIDVVDTGVGIAEEAHKYIFTRFMRALDTEFFEVRGAGLGLYMAHNIIDWHNGRIWFESQANQGSTFSFAIPIVSSELDEDEAVEEETNVKRET